MKKWKDYPPIFRYQLYQYLITICLFVYMAYRQYSVWDILIIGFLYAILTFITHIRSMTMGMHFVSTNDFIKKHLQQPYEDELNIPINIKDIDDKLKN